MTLNELAARVADAFAKQFGKPPRWIAAAPGRVNVIGEHTDYNDGYVLPMAIERYAVLAADLANAPGQVNVFDAQFQENAVIDVTAPVAVGQPKWSNYIRGVIAGFQKRGVIVPALNIALNSTVPLGGGLSSSAALEVGMATLLEAATGITLDPVEKALLAQKAEHDFAGVPCGIMDQFISTLGRKGHLLLLDCRTRKTELVPMNDPAVEWLVINTNVKHELGSGEYARRRAECETAARVLGVQSLRDATASRLDAARSQMSETVFRRARHVIGEIERTVRAAADIRADNWPAVGDLMYASHCSLREDYDVSCPELDAVVALAKAVGRAGGVYGCRMTGGGFGGCCVALAQTAAVPAITEILASGYKKQTQIEAGIFSSRPADGAMLVRNSIGDLPSSGV